MKRLSQTDQNSTKIVNITDPTSPQDVASKAYADLKLAKASNLSDLASASTARTNLGLGAIALLATVTEADITLADNTTNNASTTKHGFLKKLSNSATDFMDGTGAWDTIKDSDLSTSDITTNDVSSTKHGFAPKAVPGKHLRADGWNGITPFFDHVESGCVWTADAAGSTRAASMTAGVVWINGVRLTVAAVTAHLFTASKDTYCDLIDNADGTCTVNYSESTNNAASQTLSANRLRTAIIVTGASNIANAGSINQGEETKVLPIASSIPYTVTDSLGNLICPRDASRRTLGYRRITSNFSTASTTPVQATGLTCPVIVPAGRKVKVTVGAELLYNSGTNRYSLFSIWDGVVNSGTQIFRGLIPSVTASLGAGASFFDIQTVAAGGAKTYNAGLATDNAVGTATIEAGATFPAYIMVELV